MRILICIKQVPKTTEVSLDQHDFTIMRSSVHSMMNPNDCAAIEFALILKEVYGATVAVMTMGPQKATTMLREVATRDVDELFLLTDMEFSGSDTLATARILAAAIQKMGGCDLLLLGRRAIDGETGHVGPQLSILLGMRCITNVTDIQEIENNTVRCTRLLENSTLELSIPLPAILTICGNRSDLRPPSLKGISRGGRLPIQTLTNEDLQLSANQIGINGSPTQVRKLIQNGLRVRKCQIYNDAQTGAEAILHTIESLKLPRIPVGDSVQIIRKPHLDGRIWAFAWEEDQLSLRTAEELMTAIREMGVVPSLLFIGSKSRAEEFLQKGVKCVHLYCNEQVLSEKGCAQIVAKQARKHSPEAILFPATIQGRSIAPQCAALLSTGITADCTDFQLDDNGRLIQIRPTFGSSLLAYIECANHRPQIASVRPGVYSRSKVQDYSGVIKQISALDIENQSYGRSFPMPGDALPTDATLVISGGKGVGDKDGFSLLKNFAIKTGGFVAASRGAVDNGFAEYSRQVGQTGITIKPRVYIAFGISGAVQHMAGVKNSDFIIAINTDRRAPIFAYSNIGVVAKCSDVIEALMDRISNEYSL